jgi:molybdenum cofactor cytidylyltransferase
MRLADALQCSEHPILAFAGAGGKTTAMFRLGRELPGPVIVTTTTHLGLDQVSLADRQIIVPENGDVEPYLKVPVDKVTLFSGPAAADQRVPGIGLAGLEALANFCKENQIPLLIEADGSRGLPLKAPERHEPAIPSWVTDAVIVMGMKGVGKPLTAEYVHRPERFSEIAGIPTGGPVTVEAICKELLHPEGGLKNIPPQARRIALLNQADSDELQSLAGRIAGTLTEGYHAALIGSLKEAGQHEISACYKPAAAIILAAGGAARFGQPKPLLQWHGEPFVRRIARTALQAGLKPVVIVSGFAADGVQNAVAGFPVHVVYNPDWQSGQSSSVKAGIKALDDPIGAVFFFLSDQPQIPTTILAAELELHRSTLAAIVAPMIDGKRANPVLFDRVTFPALNSITGDAGGRQVFAQFPVTWLEWNDTSLLLDVDTPEDYQKLLDME